MTADEPGALAAAWPLFGLRIRSERMVMRLPTESDLLSLMSVAKAGIHPAGEMPFGVAWSTAPSPAFERGFLQHHWGMRGQLAAESTRHARAHLTKQAGIDDRSAAGPARVPPISNVVGVRDTLRAHLTNRAGIDDRFGSGGVGSSSLLGISDRGMRRTVA